MNGIRILCFLLISATLYGTGPRDHQIDALYDVDSGNLTKIQKSVGRQYSLMKYGDEKAIALFSSQLAERIWTQHGDSIGAEPRKWRMVDPARYSLDTAANAIVAGVSRIFAERYGIELATITLGRRRTNDRDFSELVESTSRRENIEGSFYCEEEDLSDLSLIFIDDSLVSGAHYIETQRVLQEKGAELGRLFSYYILNIDQTDADISLEDALNHVWISHKTPERILPLLKRANGTISPRVLKFVMRNEEALAYFLDHLPANTISRLYSAALVDDFDHKELYSKQVERLGHEVLAATDRRKRELDLHALYELTSEQLELMEIDGEHTVTTLYSRLKFGDVEAIDHFAHRLAERILDEHGPSISTSPSEWCVTVTGYRATPGAAKLLAKRVAERLDLPFIESKRLSTPSKSYGAISGGAERAELIRGGFTIDGVLPPNTLFIDDAVVSGAHLNEYAHLIEKKGSKIVPYAIFDLHTCDCSLEDQLNHAATPDLGELLGRDETPLLLRTIKTLLGMADEELLAVLSKLSFDRIVELYNSITVEGLDRSPHYQRALVLLNKEVNSLARKKKMLSLPAYETLYVLSDQNAEELLADEGKKYSRLKYGDHEAIDVYAKELSDRIRLHHGKEIAAHPERWAVASAGYYRTPNAASFLGDRIAELLGLERADLRAQKIFEGEFGAINDPKKRVEIVKDALYVSNPNRVRGRRILYIDDVYVSGAHLVEHSRLLHEAGADEILPYAIFDVASRELKLEKALNYALVDRRNLQSLVEVILPDESPILTRTAKFVLRLNANELTELFSLLPDHKIFALFEACEAEAYGDHACFADSYEILQREAMKRHLTHQQEISPDQVRLLLLDYDGTLADTLTPLTEPMIERLVELMEDNVAIAIITMQPGGERGISEYTVGPIVEWLQKNERDLSLLSNLHLFPCGGSEYYQVAEDGTLHLEDPIYNTGLQPDQCERLEKAVTAAMVGTARRLYLRKGYISLHFDSESKLHEAERELADILQDFPGMVMHHRSHIKGKHVLHVRKHDLSKVVARTHIMKMFRDIPREQIVTAGDKMGVHEGFRGDCQFFVHGATNFALGEEAHEGCCTDYLGMKARGLERFLGL